MIRAVNAGGNSPWSSEGGVGYASATTDSATAVPKITLVHTSREVVDLTWTRVAGGTVEYDLQRRTDVESGDDAGWERLPTNLLSDNAYTDNGAIFVEDSDTTTYYYRVQAIDDGEKGEWSDPVSVGIPETGVLPPAPANVAATSLSTSSIRVTWDDVTSAEYFELRYRVADGSWSNASEETEPYTHRGLTASTEYTYEVRSVNVNGESEWSAMASAETQEPAGTGGSSTLNTPRNLRAVDATEDGTAKLKVTWSPVSGTGILYQLLRWDEAATPDAWSEEPLTAAQQSSRSITLMDADGDTLYTPGSTHYFVIRAYNLGDHDGMVDTVDIEIDTSDWSDPANGMIDALKPAAPTALRTSVRGEDTIWLSWDHPGAVAAVDGPPVVPATGIATSYTIQWRQGSRRGTIPVTGATSTAHTDLRAGTEYYYKVRAHNSGGDSAWFPASTATPSEIAVTTAPSQLAAPTGVKVEDASTVSTTGGNIGDVTASAIKISWTAVNGADSYQLQRWNVDDNDAAASAWGSLADPGVSNESTPASGTSYDDSAGINDNVTYYYIVRAVDESGVSSKWSAVASGRTKVSEPDAPTLTMVPTGESVVRLTWVNDGDTPSGVIGYELQYAEGVITEGQFNDDQRAKMSKSLSASPMYTTISDLKAGTRYTFRIQALLAGDVESDWSSVETNDGKVVTRPARPDLTATATSNDHDDDGDAQQDVSPELTAIALTWAPAMLNGASVTAIGDYQIQKRVSGGTWADLDGAPLEAPCSATVPCQVIDHNGDDGLTAKTRYFYRIRVSKGDFDDLPSNSAGTADGPPLTSYWDTTDETTQ